MNELEQKRGDKEADWYSTDGRFYDLIDKDTVFLLQMRRCVVIEAAIGPALCVFVLVGMAVIEWGFRSSFESTLRDWIFHVIFFAMGVFCVVQQIEQRKPLIFDKGTPHLAFSQVRAWKQKRRFYIALVLHSGAELPLGIAGYSRAEYSWRQDAAQIAAFLGVPLEIPPIIPG